MKIGRREIFGAKVHMKCERRSSFSYFISFRSYNFQQLQETLTRSGLDFRQVYDYHYYYYIWTLLRLFSFFTFFIKSNGEISCFRCGQKLHHHHVVSFFPSIPLFIPLKNPSSLFNQSANHFSCLQSTLYSRVFYCESTFWMHRRRGGREDFLTVKIVINICIDRCQ